MNLVTGGAGFIGSHLTEFLLSRGEPVVIMDNFHPARLKRGNIEEIMANQHIPKGALTTITGDIRDMVVLEHIFQSYPIQRVIHLAALAGVRPSIAEPLLYNEVNIKGTLNILEMCRKFSIDQLIFASSSSVYGDDKQLPFQESHELSPISVYGATKIAGEALCHTYHHLYQINVACLRFFTVYGPRQRPDLAIHKFTKLIFEQGVIPFYGDGSTERDYTYVTDIIDGISKSIEWIGGQGTKFGIFNLGSSHPVSLQNLLTTLEQGIGKKANYKQLSLQPGDVRRTYADITKAKRVLGYAPAVSLEEGIHKFLEWYTKRRTCDG